MKEFKKLSRKDLLKILGVITLSDGSIGKSGGSIAITLATLKENKEQHDFFEFICKAVYNKKPTRHIYKIEGKEMLRSRVCGKQYVLPLFDLSPTYKTSDKKEGVSPSIGFLDNKKIKVLGLRTYFDFDGSIVPSYKLKKKKQKIKKKVYSYYQIQFECDINIAETNPNLASELSSLCDTLGIKGSIKKDKRNWSGIYGIRIYQLNSVIKFIELGGPITHVKISSKSKRLQGITKKAVCSSVLNMLKKGVRRSYHFKDYAVAYSEKERLNLALIKEINEENKKFR